MTRLKSVPLAIGGLVLAAGTVAAFTALPDAAGPGLQKASETLRQDRAGARGSRMTSRPPRRDLSQLDAPADLPDAASHGAAVSAAAQAEDTTPDTNHGARRLGGREGQPRSGDRRGAQA